METVIIIILVLLFFGLFRVYGISNNNAVKLQEISPKIDFIYEQVLKGKVEIRTNKD